jgi:hypothetical protein
VIRAATIVIAFVALASPAIAREALPPDSDGGPAAYIPDHNATEACKSQPQPQDCRIAEGMAVYDLMFKMDWGNIPARYRRDCIASAGDGDMAFFLRSIKDCIEKREEAGK